MKKTLYFLLLLICGCILGGIIASAASGSFAWLGWSRGITLAPSTFATDLISLTFGFSVNISVAQVICIIAAIYAYIKTAPKVISG
ncbi:protein of unknown function [Ruminococcus flavefaciens]|uniref:DUF4321 domain-containing protein n=1 Tax=Ruminococcus flavefaciens TaxID=1265 RepID=A0A1H6I4D3_RUMFL|nr:DUF4321 domain-containing protein [Ruminococcus flavefaciens]SEH41272.1 protein of unknown function [Ruminococcus flavefaciens]